jgi:hypothetical protein
MAQTNFTPIQLYRSTTASAAPIAGNLASGELAINITDGKLYYKDNSNVVKLLASNAGSLGSVTSVAQSFTGGLISVAGSPITTSGTLALTVAGTSGGVVYFSGASTWASSAVLASGALVLGGGAGAAPATTTTGTGVVTALGINVGTNGSFVTRGGALGTPSSGTVTNLTGTASININGTVGNTTPSTGFFTTLTASADSSFTSTGALLISKGLTADRPTASTGMIRYNTTTESFEGYSGGTPAWNPIGGVSISNDTATSTNIYPLLANATSGAAATVYTSNAKLLYKPSTGEFTSTVLAASNGIVVNSATVATSYTIAAGNNAISAGPITISNGITVTVSNGSRYVVV